MRLSSPLIPAKAGIQSFRCNWIPAFAGMSGVGLTSNSLSASRRSIRMFYFIATALFFFRPVVTNAEAQNRPKPPSVSVTTAECTERFDGEGSSPETAIEIEDFDDLYVSAIEWNYRNSEAGAVDESQGFVDLNCRWVRLSGHFRHIPYHHYRGVFAENARTYYFEGRAGNIFRPRLYFIENWAEPSISSVFLNGSDLTLVARFYDLCRAIRLAEKKAGEEWFFLSGPCHYGDATGMMLRDARVLEARNPNQRLRGEINRSVVGNLEPLPETWPEYAPVRDAMIGWIKAIQGGAESYYEYLRLHSTVGEEARDRLLKRDLDDKDDWIWFLAESAQSPIVGIKDPIEGRPFAVFENVDYRGGLNRNGIRRVTACLCMAEPCEDEWPILNDDAEFFYDTYICREITKHAEADKSAWRW